MRTQPIILVYPAPSTSWTRFYLSLFVISAYTFVPNCESYTFQPFRPFLSKFLLHKCNASSTSSTYPTNNSNSIRGSTYGMENNSTIPTPEQIAQTLGVRPTEPNVTKSTWSRAWRLQKIMIPILHMLDTCKPVDSSLNLACMWWKALAGNDPSSPVFDHGLAYDMLPRLMRHVISPRFIRFYPRLHHANVELRTAFLDKAIVQVIQKLKNEQRHVKVRLVLLGAGYDTRCLRLVEKEYPLIEQIYDLDLPRVIIAKDKLIQQRLLKRRPWLREKILPILLPVDLNDLVGVRTLLSEIVEKDKVESSLTWHTIFVFEGVMIYLNEGVPRALLHITSDVLKSTGSKGSLCFADRLENIPGGDQEIAQRELLHNGWVLEEWNPKPGLARHMGSASLLK